ncbi:GNAT family N-acetyltransferase [Christiangramia echinicola]|uniref:GNAT family N-acetyltransferase n=1 Tax=Christiangramia echinicola TaxID=279359 RepID=UPI0004007D02|nr:GNAT family N-acetyltransferase [Christiangramia echinicola]
MAVKNIKLNFNFKTSRLSISSYTLYKTLTDNEFAEEIIKILIPIVTKALPDGWQNITTKSSANNWIEERNEESVFFVVQSISSLEVLGFIFLYPTYLKNKHIDLRFGYLLRESSWGKGLGTELVKGLVNKCQEMGNIKSIFGGVEEDNIGSIKVLEKCGFHSLSQEEKTKNVIFYKKIIIA